jgi:hypothetical protein
MAPRKVAAATIKTETPSQGSHGARLDIIMSNVMEPTRIKKLLYQREPKMATLPPPSQKLVGTTCALFLRNILDRSSKYSSPNNNNAHITLKSLSQAMTEDPSLPESLANAVFQSGEKRSLDDVGDFTQIQTTRTRKRSKKAEVASGPATLLDESEKGSIEAALSASVDASASASGSGLLILEDDDEYD